MIEDEDVVKSAVTASQTGSEQMLKDLARSGLGFQDMFTRPLDHPERNMVGLPGNAQGYVIPYYDIYGKLLQFYRVRVFKMDPKYRQAKGSPNHVYFPPNFKKVFDSVKRSMVILTEGEKKAALMCKIGIPAVAFGGADSWSNRTILIPKGSESTLYSYNRAYTAIKLPSTNVDEAAMQPLAQGFQDLIDMCLVSKTKFYIVYDTDTKFGLSYQVQRAAAKLGHELRFKGFPINQIRHLVLPMIDIDDDDQNLEGKVGLDDFVLSKEKEAGEDVFLDLLESCAKQASAFPRHPNIREYINKQLQKPKLDRKQTQNLSLSVITEMDAKGKRMHSKSQQQLYYFDSATRILMKVKINDGDYQSLQETPFGKLLYRDFGLSPAADARVMQWLGSQFAAEDPIEEVEPNRIIATHQPGEDILRYQINDGQYIRVSSNAKRPWEIIANGTGNVLFESGHVQNMEAGKLQLELNKRFAERADNWWEQVLNQTRLKDVGMGAKLVSLLYYLSPWLNRWRGTQMPVELLVGEAGSGKSTLAEIRLNILTGDAKLRNIPGNLQDWNASLANAGGLHVTDNVHMVDKALKQRISDELCRIVTDPNPRIEMRKYFTEADQRVIGVFATFAFTAIQQPFTNTDLLQRAIVLEFDKTIAARVSGDDLTYDSFWKDHVIAQYGGREAWIAHHMHVLHLFFRKVDEKWNGSYKSKHRLVHFEQSLMLMAEVFGWDSSWIPPYLMDASYRAAGRADWTLEGLIAYCDYARTRFPAERKYSSTDISNWCQNNEEYDKNYTLINVRALGKYMQSNKHTLEQIVGIKEYKKENNKMVYHILPAPRRPEVKIKEDPNGVEI